jgi:ribosomal protein L35AE/L33A
MFVLPLVAVMVQTLAGASVDALQAPAGTKAIVFLFTSTDCPISNRYAPEVRRIVEQFASQGVVFRLVYPGTAETPAAIRDHMKAFSYEGVMDALRDPKLALVKFSGAMITPEAAVYVGGRIVYRGRIDDRVVELGIDRPAPRKHDLADALAAVLAGKPVAQATTQAIGCFIADLAR